MKGKDKFFYINISLYKKHKIPLYTYKDTAGIVLLL